jgi:hypothetical protein
VLIFSTKDHRPPDRFDAFNEEFARRFIRIDTWREDDSVYEAEISLRLIGPLTCLFFCSTPVNFVRDRARLRDGDDSLVSEYIRAVVSAVAARRWSSTRAPTSPR